MGERTAIVFCEEYPRGSFVVHALTAAGYAVRWVRAPETALRLAERGPVHVLVADARSDDVLLWLLTGWRRRRGPSAPIVLLTRPGDASSVALAAEAVSSPLTTEALVAAVDRAVGVGTRV